MKNVSSLAPHKNNLLILVIDASSKLPSGIMSGHITEMGAFDQCIGIQHQINYDIIRGSYCKAIIPAMSLAKFLKNLLVRI